MPLTFNGKMSSPCEWFRIVFAVHAILLVSLLALKFPLQLGALDCDRLVYSLSVIFVAVSLWCILSWYLVSGSVFDLYSLFFLAAVVFNGGQLILEVFGLNQRGLLDGRFSSDVLAETVHLVLLCIVAMHLGAIVGVPVSVKQSEQPRQPSVQSTEVIATRLVGWLLFIISVVPTAIYLRACVSTVMSSGYAAIYFQGIPVGVESVWRVLSVFFVPGVFFLLAGSRGVFLNAAIATAAIVAYSLTNFFIGDRGGGGYALVGFVWLWHRCIRAFKPWKILLVLLAMGLVFPIIGNVRSIPGEHRASLSVFAEAFFSVGNPVTALITELGTTMCTVAYTLMLVPSERAFDYGTGYLRAMMTLVPSLYWTTTEAYSTWLVWTVAPDFARMGGGLGYSFIAEAYANFGWLGSILFTFVLGYALAKLAVWVNSSYEPARQALAAAFIAFTIQYVRGESAIEVGRLFWAVMVPYLVARRFESLGQRSQK
ncbi:MAG: O-antigen polysaccharide polymerase Wzy [Armatimonadota bacterium]